MSIQSDWQPATTDEPAEFTLDYAEVKVQVVKTPESDEIQVRIATEFDTDWMEVKFDEWYEDIYEPSDVETKCERAYWHLKEWRDCINGTGDGNAVELFAIQELVNAIEKNNPGLIRG